MKFRLLLVIIVLALLVAACGPAPQIRNEKYLKDSSLITQDPCGPPCWRGITPGETAWDAAIIIIEDDPTLKDLEEQTDEESDRIGAAWSQVDGEVCCRMISDDGETVSFLIMQTAPDHTLSEVIEVYDEPDYLVGGTLSDDQGLFDIFYEDELMIVYAFIAGEDGELTGSSEVVGFAYMTSDLMELLVASSDLHAWDGYQSYAAYMESEFEVTPRITLTPTEEN